MANNAEKSGNVRLLRERRNSIYSSRFSDGALLSPQYCIVIIVDPLKTVISEFDLSFKRDLESKTSALVEAATSLNIPVIVSALGTGAKITDLIEGVSFESVGCQIMWRTSVSPWDGGDLLSLLDDSDNPVLIVYGVGQTPSVVSTVLGALQEGYDVHFLSDHGANGSPSIEAEISLLRLIQAGAVPTTLNQVLAEWAYSDPKSICRVVLADREQSPNPQKEFWRLLNDLNK